MGSYDYFETVREPERILSHLERLIEENLTLIDTQVLPSLEPHLKKSGKKDGELIKSYNVFMFAFNRWLTDYPSSLVLVPGVREEIRHRLEANGHYSRESLKAKSSLPVLKEYETLIDQSLAKMEKLPSFEPPPLYDENLALLEYLHTIMQWQNEDHKAGKADDQIVSAALALAATKNVPINVITFDSLLRNTLFSFHKIITCKQIVPNDQKPYVSALRKAEIIARGFDQDSGLIVFKGSTDQFRAPHFYSFDQEMKQIGRKGFKDAARAYNREKERIRRNINEYLSDCHEKFLAIQRDQNETKIPLEIKTAKPAESAEKGPSLLQNLESLLSLIPQEPDTKEDIVKARQGYLSLKGISEQQGWPKEFRQTIEERLTVLEKREKHLIRKEIEESIESTKRGVIELIGALDKEDSVRNLIQKGKELESLYQKLKGLD